MPLYEYECPKHGRFEKIQPMRDGTKETLYYCYCPMPRCNFLAPPVISLSYFHISWKHLKAKSEKSPEAPAGSQYEPEWDQAYQGPQVKPKASLPV